MSEYEIQIGDQVRDMTEEEIAQRKKDLLAFAEQEKVQADRQALKITTLAKLGLTADEVTALLS
jgi:copper oxidase (laccase) domain-containing protein